MTENCKAIQETLSLFPKTSLFGKRSTSSPKSLNPDQEPHFRTPLGFVYATSDISTTPFAPLQEVYLMDV